MLLLLRSRLFPVLAVRDFRWLMSHGAVHVAGMGMELLAQGWLVLLLTDSPLWVGIVSGARGAGHVGMGAFGGVLADRFNRRDLLAMVQLGRALAIGVLGFLVVTGHVELWHALVIALFQGMTDGIAAPSFNGLIYDTVGRERLLNGIAAFEGGAYLGWIAGALVFGAVITAAGVGAGLLVISGVYAASLVLLLPVRAHFSGGGGREPLWRTLREGLAYAATNRPVLTLLGLSVLVETFGFSFIIMLPVVARDVLEVGASGLGYLSASGSGGALLGVLAVAGLSQTRRKWLMVTIASGGAGAGLLLFSLSPWFATSLIIAGLVGAALAVYDASENALLQLLSAEEMRGRVLGLYGLTWGFTPLGGSIAGAVASVLSAPFAIGAGGVVILAYALGVVAPRKNAPPQSPGDENR